jgi:hypothetical protein
MAKSGEPARGNRPLAWAVLVLALIGASKMMHTESGAHGPPQPPPSAGSGSAREADAARAAHAAPLGRSIPVSVDIPAVGLHAEIMKVGLSNSGAIEVPPLDKALKAGWYDDGPTPGEPGPAVIDGHVDSHDVPQYRAAFYQLGAVRPGERVEVTRADRSVAEFTVDSVETAGKSQFPTHKVYGGVPYAALRLITCGGPFDSDAHSYEDNVIVYAHLSGHHDR